jgi:prepilin-type N-terminal cleavage/methylation domain-containing protein
MDDLFNRVARRRGGAQPEPTVTGVARRRRRGQQGFTLIELLVVIAVLAILAGIVIFNVQGVTKNATLGACQTDLKSVQTATDAYQNATGSLPGALSALVPTYLHTLPLDVGTVTWSADGTVTSTAC